MSNDITATLEKMAEEDPNIRNLFLDFTPDKFRFPKGFKYRFYRLRKKKGFRKWYCAYSVHRNRNNKFCSWVYEWVGNQTKTVKFREHRKKKDAIKRAYKLYEQRQKIQGGK